MTYLLLTTNFISSPYVVIGESKSVAKLINVVSKRTQNFLDRWEHKGGLTRNTSEYDECKQQYESTHVIINAYTNEIVHSYLDKNRVGTYWGNPRRIRTNEEKEELLLQYGLDRYRNLPTYMKETIEYIPN